MNTAAAGINEEHPLPLLREDLRLLKGPVNQDGAPTWNIYDPVRNRYYRIGWQAFQLISRWGAGKAGDLLKRVRNETTYNLTLNDIRELVEFLYKNSLTRDPVSGDSRDYLAQYLATKVHWLTWLLKNYLFIRIPIVRPNHFIHRTLPIIDFVFGRVFRTIVIICGVLGLYLAARQWETFTSTFLYFFSIDGLIGYMFALVIIKIFHELGHAYVAARYGCNISTMGVAFLVMFPVLYTDTTDSWRLVSRKKRVFIGTAGMVTEVYIALISTFLWSFLPDGIFRSIAFIFATTSWIMSLMVNTNIFMRFDGYYILSDWWGIENLQERSFSFAKWRLRNILFKLSEPMPERLSQSMALKLSIYGWCVWIYRFFLFLGIALLVYHFFIKIVGIILFAVEIIWFILLPVTRELKVWWKMKQHIVKSRRFPVFGVFALVLLLLLLIPFNTTISVPAVLKTSVESSIYSLVPARIKSMDMAHGQLVEPGDILMVLESPYLDKEIERTRHEMDIVSVRINRRAANPEDLAENAILQESLQELQSRLSGLQEIKSKLIIKSSMNGRLVDVASNLHPGRWINDDLHLGSIIDPHLVEFNGVVSSDNMSRISVFQDAVFLPDNPEYNEIRAIVAEIEDTNIQNMDNLYLTSTYGGSIAVRQSKSGQLVPENSSYKIRLLPKDSEVTLDRVVVGKVYISGKAQSYITYLYEKVAAVLVRESGF